MLSIAAMVLAVGTSACGGGGEEAADAPAAKVREWLASKPSASWSWAQDELGTAKPTDLKGDPNFEKIVSPRPDLILGMYAGLKKTDYAKLSKIAPTVAQDDDSVEYGARR